MIWRISVGMEVFADDVVRHTVQGAAGAKATDDSFDPQCLLLSRKQRPGDHVVQLYVVAWLSCSAAWEVRKASASS